MCDYEPICMELHCRMKVNATAIDLAVRSNPKFVICMQCYHLYNHMLKQEINTNLKQKIFRTLYIFN